MLMIAPERAGLWREAGVLHAHLDNMRAAILAFEHYLELAAPGDPGRQDISELLRQLRRQLNYALARTPGTGNDHHESGRRHQDSSEEHTSELQSLMRISYAEHCLKTKKIIHTTNLTTV